MGGSLLGGIFPGREGVNKLLASGGGLLSFPPVGKTLLLIILNVISFMEKIFMETLRKLLMLHGGQGLIYKFYKAGVKGILLTIHDSFLTKRFPRNLVNCFISEWFEIDVGISQDCILKSVLFLVFSGDLSADHAS